MPRNLSRLGTILCVINLAACTSSYQSGGDIHYLPYDYTDATPSYTYTEGYETTRYSTPASESKPVVVPETYHVGVFHSPTPHTDRDRDWVNQQQAQGYTIELADDDKPARVAGALYKAPKNERTAEVQYQKGGKTHYKGLYGSYPNYEAAQKALSTLPAEVQENAGIKTWGSVQQTE